MADLHNFRKFLSPVITLLFFYSISAQESSLIQLKTPSLHLVQLGDTNWIDTTSLRVRLLHSLMDVSSSFYRLKGSNIEIDTSFLKDSLLIQFRIFPYQINKPYFIYDSLEHHEPIPPEYSMLKRKINKQDWWDKSGLEYSGNYTRGLSIGNNQSLIVNSALNLQLIGDLGEGLMITGAITDNQIPIQPEGNTRQIQEFDRLYIELKKNKTSLIVGDFDLQKPQGYFQNYFKKSLGANLHLENNFKGINLKQSGSIGISKGKFNRLNISIVNSNQGPYRLRGRDGENFIIILAGSEKVFLDGILLTRGDDADYIMDYNLGELRFTPRRLVTDQMRLIVEFEYTDQNYLRSLISYNLNAQNKNWKAYLNFYRENDSKKPSVNNDLDSTETIILSNSGDQQNSAISSRVNRAGASFRPDRVYYKAKDTMVVIQGTSFQKEIFEYTANADSNSLQIVFTEIGVNKGEYQLAQSNVNGRVYQWVGVHPGTGVPLGSYAPYRVLVAPRSHTLTSIGMQYNTDNTKKLSFWLETTLSYLDKNKLSGLNDDDNLGFATKVNLSAPALNYNKWTWKNTGSLEINNKNFVALNPYRNPEFNRDWNIDSQTGFNDQLIQVSSKVSHDNRLNIDLQYNRFQRMNEYLGNKTILELTHIDSMNELRAKLDFLNARNNSQSSVFFRPEIVYKRALTKSFSAGLGFEQQLNSRKEESSDSLLLSSFEFKVVSSFVKWQKTDNQSLQLDWKRRIDDQVKENTLETFSVSDEFGITGSLQNTRSGSWKADFTARNITYQDEQLNDSLSQYNFLGQLDHSLNVFKNAIRVKNIYALQSGAEPRVEYVYEERRPGDGDYIYLDFNQDGIRQSGEYVFAPDIDTARYIKIQLFNSEYFQTYQSSINSVFSIDFGRINNLNPSNLLSKFSYESILRFSNKISPQSSVLDRINPFIQSSDTQNIIAFQKGLNQQLFFNRANPGYEVSLQYIQNENRQLLLAGIESRLKKEWLLKSRWTFLRRFDCLLTTGLQEEGRKTEFYNLQNYNIRSGGIELASVFRLNRTIRLQLGAKWKNADEIFNRIESAQTLEFYHQSQLSFSRKFNGRLDLRFIRNSYKGIAGSAVEYVMLDGLKNGNNLTAEVIIDWRLSSILFAQFSYSIRKPSGVESINTGRVSLRANF
ncbi:MAG: hypothetical protein IT267_11950 [Saprospiraceae bacterium]|nr:hypothetical protein [Saprospiraceae bacterium]